MKRKEDIRVLNFLRGFAALMVVLCHLGGGALPTVKDNSLSGFFHYGMYGVQIFFVISGFVIPYSMLHSGYTFKTFFKYLTRRFLRIAPPAYITILLIVLFYYAALIFLKRPINGMEWPGTSLSSLLINMTFTNKYFDYTWFNPVFWTLGIEFQFYIIIGLVFPFLVQGNKVVITLITVLMLALGFIPVHSYFEYSSLFLMGIIIFLDKEKIISKNTSLPLMVLSVITCFYQRGFVEFGFGFATALFIYFINFSNRITDFLGQISFSLYLTHILVATSAEAILKNITGIHHSEFGRLVLIFIYTLCTICFASLFFKYVEKPFLNISKNIFKSRYRIRQVPINTLATER